MKAYFLRSLYIFLLTFLIITSIEALVTKNFTHWLIEVISSVVVVSVISIAIKLWKAKR